MSNTKNNKTTESFGKFHFIERMFEGLPSDLWYIFMPTTEDGYYQLDTALIKLKAKQVERNQIMRIQKQFNLPFKPNMSMRETIIRVRILMLKKSKDFLQSEGNPLGNDNNNTDTEF